MLLRSHLIEKTETYKKGNITFGKTFYIVQLDLRSHILLVLSTIINELFKQLSGFILRCFLSIKRFIN